ncbi:MAG: hypothetical protein R3C44_11370 [Chloroflexota bacterium]
MGIALRERVTIDLNLRFEHAGQATALPGIVIAEVKQERVNFQSPFTRLMRTHGVRPTGFSKYCVGVSKLHANEVKHNNFKPSLRKVDKLMEVKRHD